MEVVLTTLSNDLYSESRALLCSSAILHGVEKIHEFDFNDVKGTDFYVNNIEILSNKKFMGYWLWKPYIILETLKKYDDGDIIVYIDAGVEIIDRLDSLIEICSKDSGIVICGNANDLNAAWTKRDCFVLMDCDSERFWHASHCDASFMMFRKSDLSLEFLTQWLSYGCNMSIISDLPNTAGLPNLAEYIDHRYDQSILSILAEKFELQLYRVPSQFGNHFKMHKYRVRGERNYVNQMNQTQLAYYHFIPYYNSPYYQLLNHHRTKNPTEVEPQKQTLTSIPENTSIYSLLNSFLKKSLKFLTKKVREI